MCSEELGSVLSGFTIQNQTNKSIVIYFISHSHLSCVSILSFNTELETEKEFLVQ